MSDWRIYRGEREPHDGIAELPPPPPWRDFARPGIDYTPLDAAEVPSEDRRLPQAAPYYADDRTVEAVNTALYLRRPLLVTGDPGIGKSTLAHAVARELRLGTVLRWPVNSRTVLRDGLYRYDSLGRLEEAGVHRHSDQGRPDARHGGHRTSTADLGRFVRLGPLGTALAPYSTPRVLLIDEIDKADIDLPNDLLDVFEEGTFEIPELSRAAETHPTVQVRPADNGHLVTVRHGEVRCHTFPFVVLTSNGERDFPPAFLRRCVRLHLAVAGDAERLRAIVAAHLPDTGGAVDEIVDRFLRRAATGELATDQLLNAVYLMSHATGRDAPDIDRLAGLVLQHLNVTVPPAS